MEDEEIQIERLLTCSQSHCELIKSTIQHKYQACFWEWNIAQELMLAEIKYLFVSLIRSLKGKQELLKKLQYIILVYFLSFWFTLAVLKCFTYCYSIFKLTYNNDNLLIIILLQQSAKTRQLATSLCCVVVLSPQGKGPLPHTHTHTSNHCTLWRVSIQKQYKYMRDIGEMHRS